MAFKLITDAEKLALIERLIGRSRASPKSDVERRNESILKSIAKDYTARLPAQQAAVITAMEQSLQHAERTRTRDGYDPNALRHVGLQFIGAWPFVHAILIRRELDAGGSAQQTPAKESEPCK